MRAHRVNQRPAVVSVVRAPTGYVSFRVGRVLCVRWLAAATLADAETLAHDVVRARKQAGEPLVCIALVGADLAMPAAKVRDSMVRQWTELMLHCDGMHFVVAGTGIKVSLLRSLLRGMVLVARVQRVTLHDEASDLVAVLHRAGVEGSSVAEILNWMREPPLPFPLTA